MLPRRIAIITGGGDCPGLNAVIRAVTREALNAGIQVVGIEDGFLGLIEDRTRVMSHDDVSNILGQGGTILGTSNKANPARFAIGKNPDGTIQFADVSNRCLDTLQRHNLDSMIVIGGDGTMACAHHMSKLGVPVIGVPKTIDNDILGTDLTFGFLSAVGVATEGLDRVTTTAASHHRVMVVEVMGRNAGWIALNAGIASGSDVILLPEIPFSLTAVAEAVTHRRKFGRHHTIVCVAEGARMADGAQIVWKTDPTSPDPVRLGGIGKLIAESLEMMTGAVARYVVLGHTQRGGDPVPADRILGTLFGHHAMKLLRNNQTNRMVAMQGGLNSQGLVDVPLDLPATGQRLIPVKAKDGQEYGLISAARAVGARFGDEVA